MSPLTTGNRDTRSPLTKVPLVDCKSSINHDPSTRSRLACLSETEESDICIGESVDLPYRTRAVNEYILGLCPGRSSLEYRQGQNPTLVLGNYLFHPLIHEKNSPK